MNEGRKEKVSGEMKKQNKRTLRSVSGASPHDSLRSPPPRLGVVRVGDRRPHELLSEVSLVHHHRNFGPQRHNMRVICLMSLRRDGGAHTVETASCLSPSRGDHESVRLRASHEAGSSTCHSLISSTAAEVLHLEVYSPRYLLRR